jgi:hypothetical protein
LEQGGIDRVSPDSQIPGQDVRTGNRPGPPARLDLAPEVGGNLIRRGEDPKAGHADNLLISDGVVQRHFSSERPSPGFSSGLFDREQWISGFPGQFGPESLSETPCDTSATPPITPTNNEFPALPILVNQPVIP